MALWSPMNWATSTVLRDYEDDAWPHLAVWLGEPPQLLHALASTSGTTLQVGMTCYDDGSEKVNIGFPDFGRRDWLAWRYSARDLPENGQFADVKYIPQASWTWDSSIVCSRNTSGAEFLRGVLWSKAEGLDDVWKGTDQLLVPVEATKGVPMIGLKAVATAWRGKQDYWWALMTRPMTSLLQSLPIISYGMGQQASGFMYTYSVGAHYSNRHASLWIGQVDHWQVDYNATMVTRPLSENGAITLDHLTLELILRNSSGHVNTSIPLLPNPVFAELDSASPFLELPKDVCLEIAAELGLWYDDKTELFRMDRALLSKLDSVKPSLHFGLGLQPDPLVRDRLRPCDIELPWGGLNHMHTPSIEDPNRRGERYPYFPIRISQEGRGIVLGRAFFQEIGLQVDYDKQQFSIIPEHGWAGAVREVKDDPIPDVSWMTFLLPKIMLTLVLLIAVLFLPSLKILYNIQERRTRRRKLERSWVQSHTLAIASDELSRYANAVIKKVGQDTGALNTSFFRADLILKWMKKSSQLVNGAASWLAQKWGSDEGAIRLSEFNEDQEEIARREEAARESRRRAVDRQQERLRNAWKRGQNAGHWVHQHILKPAFVYTIVKPLEWTIKLASWQPQRRGIRLE